MTAPLLVAARDRAVVEEKRERLEQGVSRAQRPPKRFRAQIATEFVTL
jgi:hypothetical protein